MLNYKFSQNAKLILVKGWNKEVHYMILTFLFSILDPSQEYKLTKKIKNQISIKNNILKQLIFLELIIISMKMVNYFWIQTHVKVSRQNLIDSNKQWKIKRKDLTQNIKLILTLTDRFLFVWLSILTIMHKMA